MQPRPLQPDVLDDSQIAVIDGPLGTELIARGVKMELPLWSAAAIRNRPDVISEIHRDYALAGAIVHTACTFRTKKRNAGQDWKRLTQDAIAITQDSVPPHHVIAGSLAPLEDCYRPDLSPSGAQSEHQEFAVHLAESGCDVILCETFANPAESVVAVQASAITGLPVWLALTAGPEGNLMSESKMVQTAKRAVDAGARAILVNCCPARETSRWLSALAVSNLGVRLGAYANTGIDEPEIQWMSSDPESVAAYLGHARDWLQLGATLVGGCCGTRPSHIRAIAQCVSAENAR